MFEEFNAKYEDFCWYEITNELSKNNIEKQTKQEIWPSSPLYAILRDPVTDCLMKKDRELSALLG